MLTIAQIELLTCDVPLVSYKRDDDKHTKKEMDDLTRRWREKHGNRGSGGQKFNMNDFLRTGKIGDN